MADIFFFTDIGAISSPQTENQAFGPVDSTNYRTNNLFSVDQDAPAIAVTDAIPFVQQCKENIDCVNLILLPINNPNFDFPAIKFFVYRGIQKDSLFDSQGTIKTPDSTWKPTNILAILHELQDKINADNGTTLEPKSENIGYHYSVTDSANYQSDDKYLETTIFRKDTIQLPLVKAGCQLGKFIGGGTPAGFQIIQDRLGYEATLGQVRSDDHIISVEALAGNSKVDTFRYWHQKEQILTYVDPVAFYGSARANNKKVTVYNGQDTEDKDASEIVNQFYNKEVVYLDIRNDQNYSYDYYDNFGKTVRLSFEQEGTNELIAEDVDYYQNWPLLRIISRSLPVSGQKSKIFFQLPFKGISDDINRYYLSSFTHEFLAEEKGKSKFEAINRLTSTDDFLIHYSEKIKVVSWTNDTNRLGANYFVFKYSLLQNSFASDIARNTVMETLFSLDIKGLVGDDNLEDGDFKTYVYSTINAPVVDKFSGKDDSQDIYIPKIGIAIDKNHVTFFAFKDKVFYSAVGDNLNYPLQLVKKGTYDNTVVLDEFDYDPNQKSVGFLTALPYRLATQKLSLKKVNIPFVMEDQIENRDYLYYLNTEPITEGNFYIDPRTLDCVTITHQEYNKLKEINSTHLDDSYRSYLYFEEVDYQTSEKFQVNELKLGLKQVSIQNNQIVFNTVFIQDTDTQLELNGLITKS